MWLESLHVEQFRNLAQATLPNLSAVNLLVGPNGSGKTSLLEAIHVLSTGRSFRTAQARPLVQRGTDQLLVTGVCAGHRLGVAKPLQGDALIRLDGQNSRQSVLTRLLPVQVFDPTSTDLLDQGSLPRRQMMDWMLFHVEPDFHVVWMRYQRVLQQRNLALRQQQRSQLPSWDEQLVQYAQRIHEWRVQHFTAWRTEFERLMSLLLPDLHIDLRYGPGFNVELGLLEDLQHHQMGDWERGFTSTGVHRGTFGVKTELGAAEQVLSRGQKKLLILGLKLSQLLWMRQQQVRCVVLLDDLESELDTQAQQRLWQVLGQAEAQVLITALFADRMLAHLALPTSLSLFHVERGVVSSG